MKGLQNTTSVDWLWKLGSLQLEERRLRIDVICLYNYLKGRCQSPSSGYSDRVRETAPWDIYIGFLEKFSHGECGQALECIAQESGDSSSLEVFESGTNGTQ